VSIDKNSEASKFTTLTKMPKINRHLLTERHHNQTVIISEGGSVSVA